MFAKNFESIAPNLYFRFPHLDKSKQNGKFLKRKHATSWASVEIFVQEITGMADFHQNFHSSQKFQS